MTGRIVVVTGTSTEVGKTVTTAALGVLAAASGRSVLVVKPVQTGIAADHGDVETVHDLAGHDVHVLEMAALEEPLAPDTAARRAGVPIPSVHEHAERIKALAGYYDVVVVEGAGGLLVRLDADGGTLLDLAADLDTTHTVEVVVVCSAGLGTLNHTELTVNALRSGGLVPAGLVIGSWPGDPGLAETCNLEDLPRVTGLPMLAVLPAGSGALSSEEFVAQSRGWFQRAGT